MTKKKKTPRCEHWYTREGDCRICTHCRQPLLDEGEFSWVTVGYISLKIPAGKWDKWVWCTLTSSLSLIGSGWCHCPGLLCALFYIPPLGSISYFGFRQSWWKGPWDWSHFSVEAGGLFSNMADFLLHGCHQHDFLIRFLIGLNFLGAILDIEIRQSGLRIGQKRFLMRCTALWLATAPINPLHYWQKQTDTFFGWQRVFKYILIHTWIARGQCMKLIEPYEIQLSPLYWLMH